jgi:hypothetical protein
VIDELKAELLSAAKDTSLPTERRGLALELLDFLDIAPTSYKFETGEYDPEVEAAIRPIKACVEAQARWYISQTFTPCPALALATIAPQEVDELF